MQHELTLWISLIILMDRTRRVFISSRKLIPGQIRPDGPRLNNLATWPKRTRGRRKEKRNPSCALFKKGAKPEECFVPNQTWVRSFPDLSAPLPPDMELCTATQAISNPPKCHRGLFAKTPTHLRSKPSLPLRPTPLSSTCRGLHSRTFSILYIWSQIQAIP